MRPELKKQIVRNASAYKLARHIVDGFVLAELAVIVVAVVWVCLRIRGQSLAFIFRILLAQPCCKTKIRPTKVSPVIFTQKGKT